MKRFLEVLPGVCISTRHIVSIEAQEHEAQWLVLVFTDIPGEDGKPISYVYGQHAFGDKEAAMVKLGEIVGQCSADA